jgi:hypothetical protein
MVGIYGGFGGKVVTTLKVAFGGGGMKGGDGGGTNLE